MCMRAVFQEPSGDAAKKGELGGKQGRITDIERDPLRPSVPMLPHK